MRQTVTIPGSFSGTVTVQINHIGAPPPDMADPVAYAISPEGDYRWYVRGSDWWMVKEFSEVSPAVGPILDLNIVRNYKDQVLSYSDSRSRDGTVYFATAHLDRTQYQAPLGPQAGRRWNKGLIVDMIEEMTQVGLSQSSQRIKVDGFYKGQPLHLEIAPQYGYLTTNLLLHPKGGRFGFTVTKVKRIGAAWMPEEVQLVNGDYSNGHVTLGSTGHVKFSNFAPHGAPTRDEVPPMAPGAILGSEDNRMYKVARDGTLVDWGMQGQKPHTPLAWGNVFVVSGAGLLLGSLSWIVFRRKPSPAPHSSPSSRR